MTFSMIFETKERLDAKKILQIIVVKAGFLKQGFYNGGFVNLRKYARGEGLVDDCSQCWQNCVKTLE